MEEKLNINQETEALLEAEETHEPCEDNGKLTECKIEITELAECPEEYHALSSNTSCQHERVLRSKDLSHLFRCGTFVPKVIVLNLSLF